VRRALAFLPTGLHRLAYRSAYRLLRVWWWVRRPSARGAAVACWWEGRLLTCGGLRHGEDPRAGAVRELREEVGIDLAPEALGDPDRLEFVDARRPTVVSVFEWRPAHRPESRVDRREIVWAGWLTSPELASRSCTPLLGLYLARRRRAGCGG
jgi:8-oxo-dGTP pyrophosphatase MutT (NUDIX family)